MKMNGSSSRYFAFGRPGEACTRDLPGARSARQARTPAGDDHATGQESFDAKTLDQNRRRERAGRRRTESLAGGQRLRIHHAERRPAAIGQHLAQSALDSRRRGNGRRQSRHVPSLRSGKRWQRRAARPWRLSRLRRLSWLRRLSRLWRLSSWVRRLPRLRGLPGVRRLRVRRHHHLRGLRGLRRLRGMLPVLGIVPLVLNA